MTVRQLTALSIVALIIGFIAVSQQSHDLTTQFLPPSSDHLLGTDHFGRDVLTLLLTGGQRTLLTSGLAVGVALVIGLVIGAVSGGVGGWVEWLLMRVVDALLAIPGILFAMALAAALGRGPISAALGVGVALAPGFARLVRTTVRSTTAEPYIEAARSLGASHLRIIVHHLIPNVLPQVIPFTGVLFAWSVLSISGLEYLGLAGSPSEPSWGRMIADGRSYLELAPWVALSPGIAIVITTLTVMRLSRSPHWLGKRKMSPEDGDIFLEEKKASARSE